MNKNLFQWTKSEVPHRSGFDKSYQNLLTLPVGTLVPLMCDEVIPHSRVNLKAMISASMAPLATDAFLRCHLALEAFFVPFRQLYAGFPFWLTGEKVRTSGSYVSSVGIPTIKFQGATYLKNYFKPGSLADYLGFKISNAYLNSLDSDTTLYAELSPLPFLAYHWIWDKWYRNKAVTKPLFIPPSVGVNVTNIYYLPYQKLPVTSQYITFGNSACVFPDNVHLMSLRQRSFGLDYFSSAKTSPQSGDAQFLRISVDPDQGYGDFSISTLRAANSLQQFRERQGLASDDYVDFLKVNFGANLTAGQSNEPIYLGSGNVEVYTKGIEQTSYVNTSVPANPFKTVGARYGNAYSNGVVPLVDDFHAEEPGYIFVMASLVPRASYSTGVNPMLRRYMLEGDQTKMANPVLQNVGQQPIFASELTPELSLQDSQGSVSDPVFGYTDRYADFMCRHDEVHCDLRDGGTLEAFALQRNFEFTTPQISSDFGYIPKTFLDQVSATQSEKVSNYGAWVDAFLDYKVSMPLNQYSIPSLENVHGKDVYVQRGGQVIR